MKSTTRLAGTRLATTRLAGWLGIVCLICTSGCGHEPKPYGVEGQLFAPGTRELVWAIAPTINLSGQSPVDPLLQSDLVFQEMQQVHGLKLIPVDRVAEVYASLRIDKVQSEQQAYLVCDLLGCDGLVVPTVTAYDPYEPPKLGASLQLFLKPGTFTRSEQVDPRELSRSATPSANEPTAAPVGSVQAVGMFDASDGSIRDRINAYAAGRSDPQGPYGVKEIVVSMDRYCGFAYHELIATLLNDLASRQPHS